MFEIAKNEDVNVEMVLQDDDNINLNYGNEINLAINVMELLSFTILFLKRKKKVLSVWM